jgi:hypothetical protein
MKKARIPVKRASVTPARIFAAQESPWVNWKMQ